MRATFGRRCNRKANAARAHFPNAFGRGTPGYVYHHTKIAKLVGPGVLAKIEKDRRHNAVDYGVWGYNCRLKRGGTTWSVHSWGVAIDTNTLRNPMGQRHWNGRGANGKRFGRYLPDIWMGRNFYWGKAFNDPMHFQYVTGY